MRIRHLFSLLIAGTMLSSAAYAQRRPLNMPEHDDKKYYFGLSFGTNFSTYRIRYTQSFAENDTFMRIQPGFGPGALLGIMGNLRLTKFVDARFIPSLVFCEKRIKILANDSTGIEKAIGDKSVESIYMHLPLQLKFKSDRIRNFRFYGMVGYKFDIDLAANARSRRTDEFLKVKPIDMGYEVGAGFEFFYPNFIFSPEIKISQGLMNQQFKDSKIPLSNAIDALSTRMIVISVHLEG
ncbi:MAG: PorT family protein [Sphingobacteriales bacterium]|nr:MAG: PorT family protein [Sphingobacteriales bacterium]